MDYLIRFVQAYETFRKPELEALAAQANVEVEVLQYSPDTPFCVVRLHPLSPTSRTPDEIAADFISRSFLSKGMYELWAEGLNYESVHSVVKGQTQHLWSKYADLPFKFTVDPYCGKLSASEQTQIVRSFSYLGFKGGASMKNPKVHFVIFEEWEDEAAPLSAAQKHLKSLDPNSKTTTGPRRPLRIFFCRHVGSTRRHLADKHDLKKRPYISTTSMDALLALVTANLALAGPGKLVLDPFVGTGGFMVAASELGAISLGSDIDGRSFRGKEKGMDKGVCANFRKYGIQDLYGDCITSDLTNSPFRVVPTTKSPSSGSIQQVNEARWLDAIISDPPYGVREGLKVLGIRQSKLSRAERLAASGDKSGSKCVRPGGGVESSSSSSTSTSTSTSTTTNTDSLQQVSITRPEAVAQDGTNRVGPYLINGVSTHLLPGYIAPKRPYSFTAMLDDILNFAAATLVDGGRLAFWMPSANEEFDERLGDRSVKGEVVDDQSEENQESTTTNFPTHPSLELKHICTQNFNKWSRKLLIYERLGTVISSSPPLLSIEQIQTQNQNQNQGSTANDLNPFRRRYFQGFQ